MNRRQFAQSVAAVVPAASILNLVRFFDGEEIVAIAPKSKSKGAVALCFGDVFSSATLPIRPLSVKVITDGTLIYFNWASQKGEARVYTQFDSRDRIESDLVVFRLRQGKPEPPYYPRWRKKEYWLYTPPGALVKRARTLIERGGEGNVLQATSDMRFAALINAAWSGDTTVLDHISDIDDQCRRGKLPSWDDLRTLLTESRVT